MRVWTGCVCVKSYNLLPQKLMIYTITERDYISSSYRLDIILKLFQE